MGLLGVVPGLGVADGAGDFDEGEGGNYERNTAYTKNDTTCNDIFYVFGIYKAVGCFIEKTGTDKTKPPNQQNTSTAVVFVLYHVKAMAPEFCHDLIRRNKIGERNEPPDNRCSWAEVQMPLAESTYIGICPIEPNKCQDNVGKQEC